jgi:hypothetical protein
VKRNDAFPGKFMVKEDFETPRVLTVKGVRFEDVQNEEQPVCYFDDETKGLVLNKTNWEILEHISGEPDSDNWKGTVVEAWVDPTVSYGGKRTGGTRLREPQATERKPSTAGDTSGDVPF